MNLAQFLIDCTLVWSLLYLIYYSFLRRETFFRLNRIYLLTALLIGVLLPLLRYFSMGTIQESEVAQLIHPISNVFYAGDMHLRTIETQPGSVLLDWVLVGWVTYFIGVLIFALKTGKGFWEIYKLYVSGNVTNYDRFTFVETPVYHLPFSFFRWIFWSDKFESGSIDVNEIIKHEITHVNELHSIDVLLIEFLGIVLWFHPLIYIYKKSIRENHEFICDHVVSNRENNYDDLLQNTLTSNISIALTNQFFNNYLKSRVMMLGKKPSASWLQWKFLLVVPTILLLLVIMAFRSENRDKEIVRESSEYGLTPEVPANGSVRVKAGGKVLTEDLDYEVNRASGKVRILSEHYIESQLPITIDFVNERRDVSPRISGSRSVIENAQVEDSSRQVELEQLPDDFSRRVTSPVITVTSMKIRDSGREREQSVKPFKADTSRPLLILYDNRGALLGKYLQFDHIPDPRLIDKINILKGEGALNKYGQQAEQGAVEIYLKNGRSRRIDGFLSSMDEGLFKIDLDEKKSTAIRPGVGMTELAKSIPSDSQVTEFDLKIEVDKGLKQVEEETLLQEGQSRLGDPLIVLYDRRSKLISMSTEKFKMDSIDPSTIEKINVIKGVKAISKYGQLARDGVVEIYLKHSKTHSKKKNGSDKLRYRSGNQEVFSPDVDQVSKNLGKNFGNNTSDTWDLIISPNPAMDFIRVQCSGLPVHLTSANIRVQDALGRAVLDAKWEITEGRIDDNLDMHKLGNGRYSLILQTAVGIKQKSFLVQN